MIPSLLLLIASIGCYSISQLAQHGKLRWESKDAFGFWGEDMDKRKYYSKIPFAKTWLVFLTDGYHLCQAIHHLLLACSLGLLFELRLFDFNYNVQAMGLTWILIKFSHGIFYKIFSR